SCSARPLPLHSFPTRRSSDLPELRPGNGRPRAVIFGCGGLELSAEEARFFKQVDPLGFILFRRNIEEPAQVRRLVAALRACVGRSEEHTSELQSRENLVCRLL